LDRQAGAKLTGLIAHWDWYRLQSSDELEYLGFRDYLTSATLQLVEWPERGEEIAPVPDVWVHLAFSTHIPEKTQVHGGDLSDGDLIVTSPYREVVMTAYSEVGAKCLKVL